MTRRFLLTSSAFDGEVVFDYNENGLLEKYDISSASLSESQQVWILKRLPRELAELERVITSTETAKLTEVKQDITFEMFWNRYDEKDRSSKKRALAKWNKMSKAQQAKAYYHIQKYFNSIPVGVAKKYAETYLNAELWNN
jgi:hypothetical protein